MDLKSCRATVGLEINTHTRNTDLKLGFGVQSRGKASGKLQCSTGVLRTRDKADKPHSPHLCKGGGTSFGKLISPVGLASGTYGLWTYLTHL